MPKILIDGWDAAIEKSRTCRQNNATSALASDLIGVYEVEEDQNCTLKDRSTRFYLAQNLSGPNLELLKTFFAKDGQHELAGTVDEDYCSSIEKSTPTECYHSGRLAIGECALSNLAMMTLASSVPALFWTIGLFSQIRAAANRESHSRIFNVARLFVGLCIFSSILEIVIFTFFSHQCTIYSGVLPN